MTAFALTVALSVVTFSCAALCLISGARSLARGERRRVHLKVAAAAVFCVAARLALMEGDKQVVVYDDLVPSYVAIAACIAALMLKICRSTAAQQLVPIVSSLGTAGFYGLLVLNPNSKPMLTMFLLLAVVMFYFMATKEKQSPIILDSGRLQESNDGFTAPAAASLSLKYSELPFSIHSESICDD